MATVSVMETDEATPADAAAALQAVQAGRAAAARRVATPWWFHPLLGWRWPP